MNLRLSFALSFLLIGVVQASNVNITTKYGYTGGIVGPLNKTTDKVNGRDICPTTSTAGCDFDKDPKWSNNGTVDNPSDDSYSGDLIVRTNDAFQAIAGWTWNGKAGGSEEVATITGTLPSNQYYEWTQLPGSCNPTNSSISADKQTIVCERKDFDKNDAGTFSEDLTFNVRVKGGTPSGAKPGDIKFKIEAPNASSVEDTTDGYSLTVTASPRWNLQKSMYTAWAGKTDPDNSDVKGWILDYKFYIESDEVSGETDNVNPIVGNESMGEDATFEFTDDFSGLPPHAKVIGCSMNGRYDLQDGYVGGADPITFNGAGSIYGDGVNSDRKIPQKKGEQKITCTQPSAGSDVHIKVEHVDATLNHYPTKSYNGNDLPVNRAIAAIGSIYVFVPVDDVKKGKNGVDDNCKRGDAGCDDGQFTTVNKLTDFDPTTPTNHSNFGDNTESEKDNSYSRTLYYAQGGWSKRFRGGGHTNYNGRDSLDYVYGWTGTVDRSGDGMVTQSAEFSTWLVTSNTGGTGFTEDTSCDVIDAYRLKIQPIKDNLVYKNIGNRYTGGDNLPYRYYIWNDDGNYTDGMNRDANNPNDDPIPYIVEYATDYVDDSFLPSKGGDTTVVHKDDIKRECTDSSVKWTTNFEDAMKGPLGITKVRIRLKDGIEVPPGSGMYFWINHKVRDIDLATNQPMNNGDLIINYAGHKFNTGEWYWPDYIPGTFPGTQSGWNGDRVMFTGPKVRIKKLANRTSASPGEEVTYTLQSSYTDDIGSNGNSGEVKITDVLPKDFKYQKGSVSPLDEFGEPTIGDCSDVLDINVTPCVDGQNQVLKWDLGVRPVNAPQINDLNYTVLIGAAAKVGTNINVVKIESPTDASAVSQRKANIGLVIDVPASINIVKSTEENPDYPSKRERTTTPKDIFFLMDMRNGKNGEITDLDVIDILPFKGDGDDEAIKFNNLKLKRKVATSYHGTSIFHNADFAQHPSSESKCDYSGKIKYYYTNADPKTINMAPTVGDANDVTKSSSIWCEGDENGPNGCTIPSTNFTFSSNSEVTAVRARGAVMEKQAICQFKVNLSVDDNLAGDNYSNSAGASATGITLPVLSNSLAVPIVSSSLGDTVWYDKNANGIQDEGENGIANVTVKLLSNGKAVKNPITGEDYIVKTDNNGKYSFVKLNHGTYQVEFVVPDGYIVSPKGAGSTSQDSDIDSSGKTDNIILDVDEHNKNIDAGLFTPVISGKVFDDGTHDGTVNGTAISTPDGTQLYVTLLDNTGKAIATKAIDANGAYEFNGNDGVKADSSYSLVLSTTQSATQPSLPTNWNSADGEHIGLDAGLDGLSDGKIKVDVKKANIPNINFGINKKPTASNVSSPSQLNPNGAVQVDVPNLVVADKEDTTPTTVTIKSLPNNAKLYYNGKEVTSGQVINGFDNSKLKVDPNDGELTVTFPYTTTDRAGVESDSATVTMPFTDIVISGKLFDDGNGDNNINGKPISTVEGEKIYVNLLDSKGTLVSSKAITDGAYSFNGKDGIKPKSDYTIVLSIVESGKTPKLPKDWNNADGENIGTKGNDGKPDGIVSVSVKDINIPEINFGINKKPLAKDKTEQSQPNPGGDNQVVVPTLAISDNEDGTPPTITVTKLPDNATLYYNGSVVSEGLVIKGFDATKFKVDPKDGDQTVIFNYTTTDKAGVESDSATVTMPFTDIVISGKLFDDGNHNNSVDGTLISSADKIPLYITLVDKDGKKVASKPLVNGKYSFSNIDGVEPNSNYTVVLTDKADKTIPSLPDNWTNADGEEIGDGGLDIVDGKISISLTNQNISEINFGINQIPVAKDKTENTQINPGSDTQVAVPTLEISDKEDKVLNIITITELPTNATLYYNGKPVTKDEEIKDVDPSKFTLDPQDGDLTSIFKYTTTDVTGAVSKEATVTMPFTALQISGHVFNDGNSDGVVNGTGISAPNGVQLYVTLLDSNGAVLSSKAIAGNGTYSFGGSDGIVSDSNYTVVLSTTESSTTPKLPVNWSNLDGEHIGIDAGTDGNNDGMIDVAVAKVNVVEVNFGINKKPVAGDNTAPQQLNPGKDTQVAVPDLNITDQEDGTPKLVTIKSVPSNGILYYDGHIVTPNTNISNLDNTLLMLDPDDGDQTVEFTYTTTDSVGVESDIATISMSFKGLKISGNIFDDGNNNGTVDGTPISLVEGVQLYATLLDSNHNPIATMPISAGGNYSFDGIDGIIPNTEYSVVLATEANSTSATLPTNWNNADGEHIGTDAGLDSSADGKISVSVKTVDIPQINFGINQQPVSKDKNATEQLNPGNHTTVVVPTLDITDREDGTPTIVTIQSLPINATLYYNNIAVTKGQQIPSFDNSKLTVDPIDGNQVVVFDYTTTDITGFESKVATVTMPFIGIKISGNVFDDGNGNGNVDGIKISKAGDTPLFVNLLDDNGSLIASYPLQFDNNSSDSNDTNVTTSVAGLYSFDGNNSITANTNYKIVLTTDKNGTTPLLPTDWNNADGEYSPSNCVKTTNPTRKSSEEVEKMCGMDDIGDGVIDISTSTVDITNINFGINERPTTQNVASRLALNPNREIQVIDLLPKDREDVIPNIVTIHTLPSGGVLYYDGVAVVADQNITDFNNSKLTVRPNGGNTAIVFTYSATDSTGWSSEGTSRVRMPFYVPAPVVYTEPTPTATPQEEASQQEAQQEEETQQEQQPQEEQPVIYNLDITDDAVDANTEGATTIINVLGNDAVGEGVTIKLVNLTDGEILWNQGTAVGGTSIDTTDTLVVEGEGTWRVVDGTITFTAEDGFEGTPTPIYYLVEDQQGNKSNIAEVSIKTDCTCKAYTTKGHDSVSAFNSFSMAFIMFITSILSLLFFRREENI